VSAPPTSVTGVQLPEKEPQVPFPSVAESRSTTPLEASTPAPPSLPLASVSGTERPVYQGPPESEADWPLGAVVSGVRGKEPLLDRPAPFVTVTDCEPEAVV